MTLQKYQRENLERLTTQDEQREALEVLAPSMPTVLDYLIARLEKGVAGGVNHNAYITEKTIKLWTATALLLGDVRSMYDKGTTLIEIDRKLAEIQSRLTPGDPITAILEKWNDPNEEQHEHTEQPRLL